MTHTCSGMRSMDTCTQTYSPVKTCLFMWHSYVYLVLFHANEKLIRLKLVLMQKSMARWTKMLTVQDLIHCTRSLFISCIFPPSISCNFSPSFYTPSISPNICWVAVLEEGAHINIQDILTSSRKGSVISSYLASKFGSLTSSVSNQSMEPRCFEPASGEVRPPNMITRSSVLEMVWFCFLQR